MSLNANTIAAGTPGYLKAAIDAGSGKDRISSETLNLLMRADFPQQMVIEVIQQQLMPRPKEARSGTAPATKPVVKKRRTRPDAYVRIVSSNRRIARPR